MENHHYNGKIHYKRPFSIAMLNYQRVIVHWLVNVTRWFSMVFGCCGGSNIPHLHLGLNHVKSRNSTYCWWNSQKFFILNLPWTPIGCYYPLVHVSIATGCSIINDPSSTFFGPSLRLQRTRGKATKTLEVQQCLRDSWHLILGGSTSAGNTGARAERWELTMRF